MTSRNALGVLTCTRDGATDKFDLLGHTLERSFGLTGHGITPCRLILRFGFDERSARRFNFFTLRGEFALRRGELNEIGRQLGGVGFEVGHHVLVGRGLEARANAATTLGNQTECSADTLGQTLELTKRGGEVLFTAGGHFGRGGRGLGVETDQFIAEFPAATIGVTQDRVEFAPTSFKDPQTLRVEGAANVT